MRQSTALKETDRMKSSGTNNSERVVQFPNALPSNPELPALLPEQPRIIGGLNEVLVKLGVEPSLTVREAAAMLRWSYSKARRYFRQVEGICVCYQPKRYKRSYRTFTIPISIFAREWQKMTGQQPESVQLIRQRLVTLADT
jgi:AraC-like DNA-binding protein